MSYSKNLSVIFLFLAMIAGLSLISSCIKNPTLPILSTTEPTEITIESVRTGGHITDDGGAEIIARGICWSTQPSPTINSNLKAAGTGSGEFTITIEELRPNTEYYARAYAENRIGLAYGNEIIFNTGIALPAVTTGQITSVTATSAVCEATIIYDGGAQITKRGVCWSISPDPDINDNYMTTSSVTETYLCNLTSLQSGTLYFIRAFVENDAGISYGAEKSFLTGVSDTEGNLYKTVIIGSQTWMAENLQSTRLNDNTPIPNITDNSLWVGTSAPAYCWYDNDNVHKPVYGALYNWYTVNTGKLCPEGWHVPTDEEFNSLEVFLGMIPEVANNWGFRGTDQGFQLKSTTGWGNNGNGNNSSGFSALPGGYRFGADGQYFLLTTLTYWWCNSAHDTDRGWYRRVESENSQVYRASTSKKGGKYVRCIKN